VVPGASVLRAGVTRRHPAPRPNPCRGRRTVLACSALKASYRALLSSAADGLLPAAERPSHKPESPGPAAEPSPGAAAAAAEAAGPGGGAPPLDAGRGAEQPREIAFVSARGDARRGAAWRRRPPLLVWHCCLWSARARATSPAQTIP
jgi:hypothetical protein